MRTSKGNGLGLQQERPGSDLTKNFLVRKEIRCWVGKGMGWRHKQSSQTKKIADKSRIQGFPRRHFQLVQRLRGREGLGLTLHGQAGFTVLAAGYESVSPSLVALHVGEDQSVREPILLKDDSILGSELEAKITMETATPTLSCSALITAL